MLDAMSARARPRRRHGARMRMCSTQPRFSPKRSLSSWLMNARTWPAIWSPSQAIRQSDRVGRLDRVGDEPVEVGLGRLRVAPQAASGLDGGVEDRPQMLVLDRPDLEPVGHPRVGHRVEVRPDHDVVVANGDVARRREQRIGARIAERLRVEEDGSIGRVVRSDRDRPLLDRFEHGPADRLPPERRPQEADDVMDPRVFLIRPLGSGVAGQFAVDVDHDQVAVQRAVVGVEVRVIAREPVWIGDVVDAVRLAGVVRHVVHRRVVGRAGEVPEAQAGDRRQRRRGLEVGRGIDGHRSPFGRSLVEREVVRALVAARPLLLDLHQHVVEQRRRPEPEPVRASSSAARASRTGRRGTGSPPWRSGSRRPASCRPGARSGARSRGSPRASRASPAASPPAGPCRSRS